MALEHSRRAIGIARDALGAAVGTVLEHVSARTPKIDDRFEEIGALLNLAADYLSAGQLSDAADRYQQALARARDSGDGWGEGAALAGRSAIAERLADENRAAAWADEAEAKARSNAMDLRSAGGLARALTGLSIRYRKRGDARRAVKLGETALHVATQACDRPTQVAISSHLALALWINRRNAGALYHANIAKNEPVDAFTTAQACLVTALVHATADGPSRAREDAVEGVLEVLEHSIAVGRNASESRRTAHDSKEM